MKQQPGQKPTKVSGLGSDREPRYYKTEKQLYDEIELLKQMVGLPREPSGQIVYKPVDSNIQNNIFTEWVSIMAGNSPRAELDVGGEIAFKSLLLCKTVHPLIP
jgi:hypothetical protein